MDVADNIWFAWDIWLLKNHTMQEDNIRYKQNKYDMILLKINITIFQWKRVDYFVPVRPDNVQFEAEYIATCRQM